MHTPKVTIYITSKNYGKYLGDAIESVLRQSIDNWELLLIDDHSTDNSREIMELYASDNRIRIFSNGGSGLQHAANLAIQNSNSEYIIRLDADDIFDEHILLVLSNFLDRHVDHALVFPDYYLIDSWGSIFAQERRQTLYHTNHVMDMPPNGACTMIRKKVLSEIGGYRTDITAQDGFDIWSKLKNNHKTGNVNIPLFYYRKHGENLTENTSRILSARRKIKREKSYSLLDAFKPIIGVIPCRQNYDIYPDLWSKQINGSNLIDHVIEKCIASDILDKIVVTCDNPAIQNSLASFNDPRLLFIQRPRQSTIRSKSLVETLDIVSRQLHIGTNALFALCYVQAPFVSTESIEESLYTLIMNDADSSIAMTEISSPLYRRAPHGLVALNRTSNLVSDFDIVYNEVRTCMALRYANIQNGSLTGSKIVNFIIPNEESFFIKTKRDFEIVKILKGTYSCDLES